MIFSLNKLNFSGFENRLLFILICSIYIFLGYLGNEHFLTDQLIINTFSKGYSFDEINRAIRFNDKWGWVGYLITPLYYSLKFTSIASTLYIGVFFLDLKYSFKKLVQIAMIAEVVFLLSAVLKIIWFTFIQTDFTLEEFTSFYPLSLQNIFLDVQIEPWFLYPLQVVNVFEVGYWFVLAAGISMAFKEDFNKSLSLVIKSYGLGLLLWITLIVFLTLNFS